MSIEYGLCEKLNHKAIPPEVAPKDWNWGFNISDLQTILPTVSTDHSVEPIYEEAQTKLPVTARSITLLLSVSSSTFDIFSLFLVSISHFRCHNLERSLRL